MNQAEWLACNDPARMLGWLTYQTVGSEVGPKSRLPSDRKWRLWVCASVRVFSTPESVLESHVAEVEELADRDATEEEYLAVDHLLIGDGLAWAKHHAANGHGEPASKAAILRDTINPFAPPLPPEVRTPLVIELAEAAYEKRQGKRECVGCAGKRVVADERHRTGPLVVKRCPACHGEGTIDDGTLDPERLAVLSDALEEAGLPQTVECWGCQGKGEVFRGLDQGGIRGRDGIWRSGYERCASCDETGRIPHPLLASLRSPGPHYRGLWSLDQCLGRE